MRKIIITFIAILSLQLPSKSMAEFEYRGIKSGMTLSEVEDIDGIKVSGWTGSLTINFKKFFGKGNNPPGLNNVFFQFTPKEHGQKLWRVSLRFTKIDSENMFTRGGIIEEAAQELVIKELYPDAVIKEQSESYRCGDYDYACKADGNGIFGTRTWIYVLLIDDEILDDAVNFVFSGTVDKY
mgnify:CR=1 FL=1